MRQCSQQIVSQHSIVTAHSWLLSRNILVVLGLEVDTMVKAHMSQHLEELM